MSEIIYAVYDNGNLLGEHTSKEWEELLSISRRTVRDYAREGRTYGKRYEFKVSGIGISKEIETDQKNQGISKLELIEFKRSVKVGDKFDYVSYRKDFVCGARIESEKVIVVRKYPHIVQVASLKDSNKTATMTYTELLIKKKSREKKKLIKGGIE